MPPSPLPLRRSSSSRAGGTEQRGAVSPDDLRCGQRTAAHDGQKRRGNRTDLLGDLVGEFIDLDGQ